MVAVDMGYDLSLRRLVLTGCVITDTLVKQASISLGDAAEVKKEMKGRFSQMAYTSWQYKKSVMND